MCPCPHENVNNYPKIRKMERRDQITFDAVRISTKAMNALFENKFNSELILISPPGSSGARVSIFKSADTEFLYAVKCARDTRISLSDEVRKRDILAKYIPSHLPEILWTGDVEGFETIISECNGVHTLHNLIINGDLPHDQLLSIWEDAVSSFITVWKNSKTFPFNKDLCPRDFSKRIERIAKGLYEKTIMDVKLSNIWDKNIYVNGEEYPSIAQMLENISNIGTPSFGVTCHGDPQPSNIIVGREANKSWYCVDWEWSGPNHDWRMMASHLYGWWFTRCITLKERPLISVTNRGVELNYHAFLPNHFQSYPQSAFQLLEKTFGENLDEGARRDINKYLAALYLGDLRFLGIWNREVFAVPLLAQGVITANRSVSNLDNSVFDFSI